ncbi:hypothetical protein [Jiella pacifica]|uniref:UrcA family protein n=1 Tax=Jiella pacifica TaxID=2696469 RepID=A0A6N9TAH2_9HYPH|nr:hypothetical protein [Jiella pacifica]NDW07215.1 hypothetical protein [Jiella pacifica]
MPQARRRLVGVALAFAFAASPASAQTETSSTSDPLASDEQSMLVEVSLGDWGVKTSLASKLSRKVSEIPLTVKVPSRVAREVCPIDRGDLEQQAVVSPTRTCAAKKMTDALESAVRDVVPAQ